MIWYEIIILGCLTGFVGSLIAFAIDMKSKPKDWIC